MDCQHFGKVKSFTIHLPFCRKNLQHFSARKFDLPTSGRGHRLPLYRGFPAKCTDFTDFAILASNTILCNVKQGAHKCQIHFFFGLLYLIFYNLIIQKFFIFFNSAPGQRENRSGMSGLHSFPCCCIVIVVYALPQALRHTLHGLAFLRIMEHIRRLLHLSNVRRD